MPKMEADQDRFGQGIGLAFCLEDKVCLHWEVLKFNAVFARGVEAELGQTISPTASSERAVSRHFYCSAQIFEFRAMGVVVHLEGSNLAW